MQLLFISYVIQAEEMRDFVEKCLSDLIMTVCDQSRWKHLLSQEEIKYQEMSELANDI